MPNYKPCTQKRKDIAPFCLCGKSNKDGKFVPWMNTETGNVLSEFGYCHSCDEQFFPNDDKEKKEQETEAKVGL